MIILCVLFYCSYTLVFTTLYVCVYVCVCVCVCVCVLGGAYQSLTQPFSEHCRQKGETLASVCICQCWGGGGAAGAGK